MSIHRRIKQALFPIICTVFSLGFVAVVLTEIIETNTSIPFYGYIGIFIVPFAYLVIAAVSLLGLLSKDGATVLCIIFIPLFIVLELFIMFIVGFMIPLDIDGIG